MPLNPDQIARVCHEANRGYQAASPSPGIPVAPCWDDFPDDQKRGVIRGVEAALSGADARQLHDSWFAEKVQQGWRHGQEKDAEAKTHPCLVPYDFLPPEQRKKDDLFRAIALALVSP